MITLQSGPTWRERREEGGGRGEGGGGREGGGRREGGGGRREGGREGRRVVTCALHVQCYVYMTCGAPIHIIM